MRDRRDWPIVVGGFVFRFEPDSALLQHSSLFVLSFRTSLSLLARVFFLRFVKAWRRLFLLLDSLASVEPTCCFHDTHQLITLLGNDFNPPPSSFSFVAPLTTDNMVKVQERLWTWLKTVVSAHLQLQVNRSPRSSSDILIRQSPVSPHNTYSHHDNLLSLCIF